MRILTPTKFSTHGFSLIEMAIVLFIVALLLGGLLPTLTSQVDQRHISETNKQLNEIKEALIGYAIINGRLPCPAAPNSTGVESPSGGACSNLYNGFVPASSLGLAGTDSAGYAVDAWGNRIHYAVSGWSSNTFTTSNGMKSKGISNLSSDLLVCSTATGISASSCAAGASLTMNGVPVVIFSTGINGARGSAGSDEEANLDGTNANGNKTFVSHNPTSKDGTNGEFDDIVIWISPNVLINRMVAAGTLP
jgi:prepilin-type N-terminal cleavage/methylation domain-containing protein